MSPISPSPPLIGVGVVIWRGEQILLGNRIDGSGDGVWQFPGGHLEAGESVTGCAAREVKEETGLAVQGFRHLGYTEKPFKVAGKQYITLLVSCDYKAGEARVMEPDKCSQWRWFDYRMLPRQMPGPLFEPIEIFMSQLDVSLGDFHGNSQGADLLALHRASLLMRQE